MIIALDFDETFTADPALWTAFIVRAHTRLHKVTFVTYRPPHGNNEDIEYESENLGVDIVYTSGKQKQHCFKADIWIDDSPETIVSYDLLKSYKHGCEVNGDTDEGHNRN